MAALYGVFGGEARYCILTTQANASVAPVHHRMPLVLRAQEVRPWLEDEQTARRLLHETPPELERRRRTASCGCCKKRAPEISSGAFCMPKQARRRRVYLEPEPFV